MCDSYSVALADVEVCDKEWDLACDNGVGQPCETKAEERACDKGYSADTNIAKGVCDSVRGQACDSDAEQPGKAETDEWACDGVDVVMMKVAESWACDRKYDNVVKMDGTDEWACDKGGMARLIGSLEVVRIGKRQRKGKFKYVPIKQQERCSQKSETDSIHDRRWMGGEKENGKKVPGERMGEKTEIGDKKEIERWWERDKTKLCLSKSKSANQTTRKIKQVRKKSKVKQTTEFRGKISNKITKYFYQVPSEKVCVTTSENIHSVAVQDHSSSSNQDRDWVGVGASGAEDWAGVQENGVSV